jgi:hypothetical protein
MRLVRSAYTASSEHVERLAIDAPNAGREPAWMIDGAGHPAPSTPSCRYSKARGQIEQRASGDQFDEGHSQVLIFGNTVT